MTAENIKLAFDTFDTNHDGKIEIEEFKSALPKNVKGSLKPVEGLTKHKGGGASKSQVYDEDE